MAVPTYQQLVTLSSPANGLAPESIEERILSVMAMLASGTNPDGSQTAAAALAAVSVMFDSPPSGTWIIPPGTAGTGTFTLNQCVGCWLLVGGPMTVSNIGFDITTAGDATSVAFLSLYQKTIGVNTYNQVLAEQTINVGAGTGIEQVPLSLPIRAGRYIGLIRFTSAGTLPTIATRISGAGGWSFAFDITEATTDASRGGIHQSAIGGYAGGVPPVSFSLVAGTRSVAPLIFVQAQ